MKNSEIRNCELDRFLLDGGRKILMRLAEDGILSDKIPLLSANKKKTKAEADKLFTAGLIKALIEDKRLLLGYMLGENVVPFYGVEERNGKLYTTITFSLESDTETIRIRRIRNEQQSTGNA